MSMGVLDWPDVNFVWIGQRKLVFSPASHFWRLPVIYCSNLAQLLLLPAGCRLLQGCRLYVDNERLSFVQKTRRPIFNFQFPVNLFFTRPPSANEYVVHQNNPTTFFRTLRGTGTS